MRNQISRQANRSRAKSHEEGDGKINKAHKDSGTVCCKPARQMQTFSARLANTPQNWPPPTSTVLLAGRKRLACLAHLHCLRHKRRQAAATQSCRAHFRRVDCGAAPRDKAVGCETPPSASASASARNCKTLAAAERPLTRLALFTQRWPCFPQTRRPP